MAHPVAVRGGSVLLPDGRLAARDLYLADGLIAAVGGHYPSDEQIDARGLTVLPGLIDLHTHGIRLQSATYGSLADYARAEAEFGATGFCATLFGPPDTLADQMLAQRGQTDELRAVPQLLGFRLESPYLAHTGAGIARDLAPIDDELTDRLLDAGGGHIRIWDVSPELPGAQRLISSLFARGIVSSIAHTSATIDQARAAVEAGARLVTHLFDVFDLPRASDTGVYPVGLVDYLLVEDRLTCELIDDGVHVAPFLMEKSLRCKGVDRIALVTDSNLGAGLPPGRHMLPGGWGEAVIQGPNDGVRLADRGMTLAGSALTPIDALRNAVRVLGRSLAEASRMCSTTPARLLGLPKGEIAPGLDADLVLLDRELRLRLTIARGSVVWRGAIP